MGVFDDKKFESLDWISQATEPIDSQLNNVLTDLPDELLIDFNIYKSFAESSYDVGISISRIVGYLISYKTQHNILPWAQREALIGCFKLEFSSDVINIDFEKRTLSGEIKLIKIKNTIDEDVLKAILGQEGIESAACMNISHEGLSRANEVMELLGLCQDGLRSRSERNKRIVIRNRLKEIFKTNEWNIRDTELANKVGSWIRDYIENGNLASFSNFCKLKVMTHKGQPIYSMEEIK